MSSLRKTVPGKVHFRNSDLARGVIAIDRPRDADWVWYSEVVLTTDTQRFVPVVRIPRLGYLAMRFAWWPFGRRYRMQVSRISD